MQFAIGDQVLIGNGEDTGVVRKIDDYIEVVGESDRMTRCISHSAAETYLRKTGKVISLVDQAVSDYHSACEQFEAAELDLEKAKAAVQDARLNLRDALDGET